MFCFSGLVRLGLYYTLALPDLKRRGSEMSVAIWSEGSISSIPMDGSNCSCYAKKFIWISSFCMSYSSDIWMPDSMEDFYPSLSFSNFWDSISLFGISSKSQFGSGTDYFLASPISAISSSIPIALFSFSLSELRFDISFSESWISDKTSFSLLLPSPDNLSIRMVLTNSLRLGRPEFEL